jgi:hypothetical protein
LKEEQEIAGRQARKPSNFMITSYQMLFESVSSREIILPFALFSIAMVLMTFAGIIGSSLLHHGENHLFFSEELCHLQHCEN